MRIRRRERGAFELKITEDVSCYENDGRLFRDRLSCHVGPRYSFGLLVAVAMVSAAAVVFPATVSAAAGWEWSRRLPRRRVGIGGGGFRGGAIGIGGAASAVAGFQ